MEEVNNRREDFEYNDEEDMYHVWFNLTCNIYIPYLTLIITNCWHRSKEAKKIIKLYQSQRIT